MRVASVSRPWTRRRHWAARHVRDARQCRETQEGRPGIFDSGHGSAVRDCAQDAHQFRAWIEIIPDSDLALAPSSDALTVSAGAGSHSRWMVSIVLYVGFAAAVFLIQGPRPLLSPDHLSYIQLADSIMASCASSDFWRETNSNRSFGVLLSYLYPWTGS